MATPNNATRADELETVYNSLDADLLKNAYETLKPVEVVSADPDQIETVLASVDFELLDVTRQHLQDIMSHVYDPVLRDKNRFIDSIDLSRQNLALLVDPFFEEFAPEDALTEQQAKRFVVQTYSKNKLIRQHGAAQTAARGILSIITNLKRENGGVLPTEQARDMLGNATSTPTGVNSSSIQTFRAAINGFLEVFHSLIRSQPQSTDQTDSVDTQPASLDPSTDQCSPDPPEESSNTDSETFNWVDDRELNK